MQIKNNNHKKALEAIPQVHGSETQFYSGTRDAY